MIGETISHYRILDTGALRTNLLSFVLVTNEMNLDPGSPPDWLNPTNPHSRWIGVTNETNIAGAYLPVPGPNILIYRTTFDLTGYQTNTAVITGQFAADDQVMEVRLNGTSVGVNLAGNGRSPTRVEPRL